MTRLTTAPPDRLGEGVTGRVPGVAGPFAGADGWIPRQRRSGEAAIAPTMAPWVPAVRVGGGPRDMISGARIFAGLAALLVLTRRGSEPRPARRAAG